MKSTAGPATLLYDKVNDNNGTMYNGSCLDFDGTDDFVSIADDSTLDITGDMTVSCWVALDSAMNNNLGILVNKRDAGDYTTPFLIYFEDRSGQDSFKFVMGEGSSSENIGSDDNFNGVYGKWDHVVATIFGTTMSIYVNGVLDTTGTFSGSRQTNNIPIRVGASYTNGSNDYPTTGQMADVRVYSAALSAANVKEIYDDSKVIIPSNISQTNLKGWWSLTEGAGTLCYDGSGNGNTGTITNGEDDEWLTGQTGAPQLVEGYNRPLLGDAATDLRVNFGDPSTALDIGTGQFTLGYWINPKTISGSYVGHVTYTAAAATARFEVAFHGSTVKVFTTNSSWNDTGYAPPLNKWTHILFKRESGSITMHVDGLAEARWTLASSVTLGPCTSLTMLNHGAAGGYPSLDGLLNEVVFYTVTSTDAQIAALAAKSPAALSGELTSSWVNRDFSAGNMTAPKGQWTKMN